MNNPASWNPGSGSTQSIIEGNPDEENNYAKGHGCNVWEDDIEY